MKSTGLHGTQPKEPKLKSRKQTVFPKVPDQHKVGKPLIPNGLGVLYVLTTTIYLFSIYFMSRIYPSQLGFLDNYVGGVSASLTLAVCVLFGGFMGLLDDFMDLKWRYKAFMPLIAALPLMYYAFEGLNKPEAIRTSITLPFIGELNFGAYYVFLIIPLIVMVVTNVVNMLGRLKRVRNPLPSYSHRRLNRCFTSVPPHGWTPAFLASA